MILKLFGRLAGIKTDKNTLAQLNDINRLKHATPYGVNPLKYGWACIIELEQLDPYKAAQIARDLRKMEGGKA